MAVKRVKVNRRWVWQARVAYEGERRSTIRETKPEAKIAEGQILTELKERAGRAAEETAKPATLRSLFELYAQDLVARGKGNDTLVRAVQTAHVVERLMPELLDRAVDRIGDADIFAFRKLRGETSLPALEIFARATAARDAGRPAEAERLERQALAKQRDGTKPATINRDMRTLRAMLRKARPGYRFPIGAFFAEDETRVRWLRPEEELLVFETMRSPLREIAKLAALTLMRSSEVRLLRREYVHLEQGVLMLPKAKAGARTVMLNSDAQKILRGQLASHESEWVFPVVRAITEKDASGRRVTRQQVEVRPYDRSYIGRMFRKAARGAGLRDFRFHDLRHHGATMALNRRSTAPIVMALGGWKTERMMRRYAAVTDETLRAASEAVAGNETWQRTANPAKAKA